MHTIEKDAPKAQNESYDNFNPHFFEVAGILPVMLDVQAIQKVCKDVGMPKWSLTQT